MNAVCLSLPVFWLGAVGSALLSIPSTAVLVARSQRRDPTTPAGELTDAASEALASYRSVFGNNCWNARDRMAFDRLARVLERRDR